MATSSNDRGAWHPLGQLGQGSSSRQLTGDLRDPFLSPTEERHDFPSPTRERGSQYNGWGYQMSTKEDEEDFDTASLTAYSPSAASFRRRSTFGAPPPPKTWYSFNIPHPFPEIFEAPPLFLFLLHTFLCAITYPVLYLTALIATGRTLFWARVFVGAGCGFMGLSLGITILELAQALLEASTWATLIHKSNVDGVADTGMRLRDLCVQANEPQSVLSALYLLWGRRNHVGTRNRNKGYYDGRWWTGYILLFIFSVVLSACLPFILGRTVDISTISQMQNETFEEVLVAADLSPSDLETAANLEPTFTMNTLFTWTLEPFSVHGGLPTPLALQWGDETVYFSEVIQRQLQPNGTGFGTFESQLLDTKTAAVINSGKHKIDSGLDPGAVLSFPRWGIRIQCERIPDLASNMIPFSLGSLTYLFTPRVTVQRLFDHFNLKLPASLDQPLNVTKAMIGNDTFPSTLDPKSTLLSAAFWGNGVAVSVKSTPVSTGEDGRGFITLENVLVRLNSSYAPHGSFGYRNPDLVPDKNGIPTFVGYDAAVCLQLYEPWILHVYNTSIGPPATMNIFSKVNLENMDPYLPPASARSKLINDPNAKRMLNSSALKSAYVVGHENSVNQVIKDNGRDSFYVPSPTLVSFTDGSGPQGYTAFSAELYAKARAVADASNVLPYFAGSGQLVARRYQDKVVTIATLNEFELILAITLVFTTGLMCAIFVPRLPLGVPRRGFNLYSWILAFHAKEVEVEGDEQIVHGMELDHLQDYTGDATLRYRVVKKVRDKMGKMMDEPEDFVKYRT